MISRRASGLAVWPWHPWLVAALPVVEFYRVNYGSAAWHDAAGLIAAYALFAALAVVLLRVALGTTARAALAASAWLVVILRGGSWDASTVLGYAVLALALCVALGRVRDARLRRPTLVANLVAAALVALPVARTVRAQWIVRAPLLRGDATALRLDAAVLPDIYYIVADGLGEPDMLEARYGVPRAQTCTPFERLGFTCVARSRASYPQTALSLASTLNCAPIQHLLEVRDVRVRDRRPLGRLIADNRVVRTLRGAGYRIATIPSGYELARLDDADLTLQPRLRTGFFVAHNLRNTLLPHLLRLAGYGPGDLGFALHRHRLRAAWRDLPRARARVAPDTPLFVFAHVIAPHPPFVFGAHGEPRRSTQRFAFRDGDHWLLEQSSAAPGYRELYAAQARYVVTELAAAVESILVHAPRPTLVIVQGDHGPGDALVWDVPAETDAFERHGMFNAWHVPKGFDMTPPVGSTSVNTFRDVFAGLGAPLPRLDERAWFAAWSRPYAFLELGTPERPAPWLRAVGRQAAELP